MLEELRDEGQNDDAVRQKIAELLDDLVQRMTEEGYINLSRVSPDAWGYLRRNREQVT